jgi:hypothetical protein
MVSLLRRPAVRRYFSIALILSAALDALSTLYATHWAGTWDVEDNPAFRGLARATSGTVGPVGLLLAMKVATASLSILWLRLTLSHVPDLYPATGKQFGFVRFANFLFCGTDIRGWRSLFLLPQLSRLYRGLSVPVVMVIIVGGFSASVVNTFHLLRGTSGVIIFWVVVAGVGTLAGLEMLRRDFLALSRHDDGQPSASPNGGPAQRLGNSGVGGGPPSVS